MNIKELSAKIYKRSQEDDFTPQHIEVILNDEISEIVNKELNKVEKTLKDVQKYLDKL